ncbi:MAG: D-lactate dehydrogenase [Gammaproteobacteria bacterium]|nr:MAG: D-lactate dehydrogenase [Gammaproteobacteria bacterium]
MSQQFLDTLTAIVGKPHVLTHKKQMVAYCKGFRYGDGDALAVVFPNTLLELWEVTKACATADKIIIMQAANTGVTGGSTPQKNYDREAVIVNTMRLDTIQLINNAEQVIAFPGSRLYDLENLLAPYDREPHSVIGSSCIGASIVGGVCNNSGGALLQRGPAYTEMSLFAKITETGEVNLINHLGIDLGETPEEILENLCNQNYQTNNLPAGDKLASDNEYQQRVREVNADTPSRFNQDERRLFEASGCAGKLVIFAVRLDTFEKPKRKQTFYIGVNQPQTLTALRRHILSHFQHLPESGEYLHRDWFDICDTYGKDQLIILRKFGSEIIPKLFKLKAKMDAWCKQLPLIPNRMADHSLQWLGKCFPDHLPKGMRDFRKQYEHHLILTMEDDGIAEAETFLNDFFREHEGNYFKCNEEEGQTAILHRFVAAGASARYQAVHSKRVGDLMSLDIALRRNDPEWFEVLPPEINALLDKKLYCGHFFCHVMHQDYILKKGVDAHEVKEKLLAVYEQRGAEYPAEHNVGTLYKAKPVLKNFYRQNDPTNSLNPGIGKTSKLKNWAGDD